MRQSDLNVEWWDFAHQAYLCLVDLEEAYDHIPVGSNLEVWGAGGCH